MKNRAPSVNNLCTLKDVTPNMANLIRKVWKNYDRSKLTEIGEKLGVTIHHGYIEDLLYFRALVINKIADYHGVEYLGVNRGTGCDVTPPGSTIACHHTCITIGLNSQGLSYSLRVPIECTTMHCLI